MKRTEDFIRELESGNVLMTKEVTFNEYIKELRRFEANVCRLIAGEAYHNNMRIDEALYIMESTARKVGVLNHPAVHNGIVTMKKLTKELAITMSGANGEKLVAKTLKYLNRPNTRVYHNVYITDGREETELDAIVLTDSGIIILEIKNVKSDITLTEDGRMVFASDECYDKIPLGKKMEIKRKVLKNALRKAVEYAKMDIPVYVDSYIVFSAPKGQYIKINDRYHKAKYCFRSVLNQKIENYIGCAYYNDEQLKQLDKIIADMESNVKRFETELNYDDVRRSLAEAIVVIQNGVEDRKVSVSYIKSGIMEKVIDAKAICEKIEQKFQKYYGFENIVDSIHGKAVSVVMTLKLKIKHIIVTFKDTFYRNKNDILMSQEKQI